MLTYISQYIILLILGVVGSLVMIYYEFIAESVLKEFLGRIAVLCTWMQIIATDQVVWSVSVGRYVCLSQS